MKFGISLPIHRYVPLKTIIELAKKSEALRYDSVWASDHVVIPNKHLNRFSDAFYDAFVLLSAIAAVTEKIKIGTSVIILPYRNPIIVAKAIATLDVLSEGRVIFGAAAGWMKEEFDILGIPFNERGKRTDEYIKIIKELWEKDDPKFDGEFTKFSDIAFLPKPYQKPHPPIWIGGSSDKAVRRAALLGDGWQPTWMNPAQLKAEISRLKDIAESAGRDSSKLTFAVRNRLSISDGKKDKLAIREDGPPFALFGTVEEISGYIQEFKEAGASHIIMDITVKNDEAMFEMLEKFASQIMPRFK